MRKAGKAAWGVFPSASSATAASGSAKKPKPFPLAVVDAMQLRHQPLYRLVGRQGLAAGIGVGLAIVARPQGVKNDLVDIETHVTKP